MDLGSAMTRAVRVDQNVMIEEPSVVALDFQKLQILAVGYEAKDLLGKSPENMIAVRPLQNGVISDYDLTQALIEHYIHRLLPGISMVAPRLVIAYPSGATDVEQRALEDACLQSGVRDVFLVEESMAAAYGAGVIQNATQGAFILNIGAGTTEVAMVNSYGVIASQTVKRGGDALDRAIREFVRDKYDLMIGENTAEKMKCQIGTLRADRQQDAMEVSGRDLLTGMPKSIDLYAEDVTEAILPFVREVVENLRLTLEKTPPELSADVMKRGVLLTGAGARIDGLDAFIQEELRIEASLSKHPDQDTILGCRYLMLHLNEMLGRGERDDSVQKD